ncbi:hypothetical protein [Anaerobacterium chartisolvens]|uniref:hypothetical protein n=1 Tax=Anaerobacterium chartisolvens TaxID=1297424 RepID=UPI001A9A32D3|nr:hypothetical protein [Anaerobacterium chartisolvens]
MMGEFAYLEQPEEDEFERLIQKSDYGRVFIPALVGGTTSSILRYTGAALQVSLPLFILSILITIILFGDIFNNSTAAKWILRASAFCLLGIVAMFSSEYLYIPIVIYGTGNSMYEINNNPFLNFALSLPAIIMQYLALAILIAKKRTLSKTIIFKTIFESKLLSTITIFLLIFDIGLMLAIGKLVVFDKILINYSLFVQLLVIISTFLFPILNISVLIWSVYYISNKEKSRQEKASDSIRCLIEKIQSSMDEDNNNAGQIKLNMLSFNYDLLEIADYLSTNNKKGERSNE